ncbi:MAG: S49 family peptidase [Chloroflexi bacterium]|nr:S49 family peptidase [Chloroflexota bacterium]
MPWFEATKRMLVRGFTAIPFFILLGLILGTVIAVPVIPQPKIATVTISGPIFDQFQTDDILETLKTVRDDNSIKAVVLRIDSPGGSVSAIEQIYLDVLQLRQEKPVVASIGTIAASGGYYIAVASNFVYAQPTSQIGSIGALVSLPRAEALDEDLGTTGPFKATGRSRRNTLSVLEMVRQEFVGTVMSQRGERLRLSDEELSQAQIYVGVESLRYGLIDDIGTSTAAIEKAAILAGLRNYEVVELNTTGLSLFWFFGSADMAALKTQTGLIPKYYYLYFETE